jgi:lipopolysaccharide assembly protein A
MQKLGRLIAGIFLLLVFIAGILFSFLNTTPVAVSFGWWILEPRPVAVWIIAAFTIGGLLGLIAGTGIAKHFRQVREIKSLRRQLLDREFEAEQMRGVPPKGQQWKD